MIPTQQEHDPADPSQHVVWALRNLPMVAGVGAITHPGYLSAWSEHLWKAGFRHRDYLESLADENGNIHVSKLPEQQIKFHAPFRGQHHDMNNAARWVGKDEPDPVPVRIPDIRVLTQQENEAMIRQYRDAGLIKDSVPGPVMAEELNE